MVDSLVLPEPWGGPTANAWAALRRLVPHDAAALWLVAPDRPDAAGLLASRGVAAAQFKGWLESCGRGDPLLVKAGRTGACQTKSKLTTASAGLPAGVFAALAAEHSAPGSERLWVLALGRKTKGFSEDELARVQMVLSLTRGRFETPPPGEPGMRRVLVDGEGRLIHADLQTRLSAGGDLAATQTWAQELLAIEQQRWLGRPGPEARDLFPPTPDGPARWVRLRRLPVPGQRAGGAVALAIRAVHGIAPPPVGLVPDERIARAIGVLTAGYADAPPLNDLAGRFGVSPFHFQRLFTAQAGVSPKHLVLRVQLLHARWRLRTTLDPIHAIAEGCGFSSHGHFTATFHRLVGVTPLDYRLGADPPPPPDR